jgi:hypothetical protein
MCCVGVHLADWPEVGNGQAEAGWGRSRARRAKVTRSKRLGRAGKARAGGAGIVAARFLRRDVSEDGHFGRPGVPSVKISHVG